MMYRCTASPFLLFIVLTSIVLISESYSFMKGPCRQKRWSKCHPTRFAIVKKRSTGTSDGVVASEISDEAWKELVRNRAAINSRQGLLKVLRLLRADISADYGGRAKK
eukprot:Seg7118.1 transcript_id=Seg7118.1/GoldUCD/mRNA.D3Y31 product="hypothetical protein" protein_id=Seg7118.1/GoldUCD/D3Y31